MIRLYSKNLYRQSLHPVRHKHKFAGQRMKCTGHMHCTFHTYGKLFASRSGINTWLDLSVLCTEGLPAIYHDGAKFHLITIQR